MEDCTTPPRRPSIRVDLLRAHGSPTGYLYRHDECRCAACRGQKSACDAAYRAAHHEDIAAYRVAHREEKAAYRATHRDELVAYSAAYGATHRDERAAYCAAHSEDRAATAAAYRATRREEIAASRRERRYGLLPGEWEEMLAAQGNSCAICGTTEPGGRGAWHTDHDHKSGTVRGILCHHCNTGLGYFGDDPERLTAASGYLALER